MTFDAEELLKTVRYRDWEVYYLVCLRVVCENRP
jgi:hypothetical protein